MRSPKLEGTIGGRIYHLRRPDETKPPIYTQEKLGKKLGVTGNTVDKWEHGRTQPSLEMVAEIAKLFDTSCDYIITGVKPSNKTLVAQLGLSNASIEHLKSKKAKMFGTDAKAINLLLQPPYRKTLIRVYKYLSTDYRKPMGINENGGLVSFPRMVFPPLIVSDNKYDMGDVVKIPLLDEKDQGNVFDKAELVGLMTEIEKTKEEAYKKAYPVKVQFVEEDKNNG